MSFLLADHEHREPMIKLNYFFKMVYNLSCQIATFTNGTHVNISDGTGVSSFTIASVTAVFFIIGFIGITGNAAVIYIVASDSKMRMSMTNILIMNLALSDLCILMFGIPEIAQFMLNQGWLIGPAMCKIERSILVASLYVAVMTLLTLCVER